MEQDDLKEKLKMDFPTPENRFNETLARCKKKHHRIRYFGLALSIVIVCALLVIIPVIFSNNKSSIASAKQGIINMYKDEEVNTTGSFERLTSYGGYKLTWSVIGNEDNVVLEEVDDKVIVKINNNNDEDISYQLKVVITNDEESEEIVWNYVIPKMEREILIARFCDVEVFDLEELDKYVRFNSYYIYTIAELNTSNWIPSFNLVMIPFEGFDPIVLTDLKQSDNNDIYYFNYFILITNDIVNNEVVFCDCEINDVSILVVYDNIDKDKAEFYQEYPVQTSDYITYKKVEKDLSKIVFGNWLKSIKWIFLMMKNSLFWVLVT